LAKRKNHEVPRYAASSTLLSLHSFFGPNILLSTLFSNTLSQSSSFNVGNQVSHPYRTTGKVIVPYSNFYVFGQKTRRQKVLD
jgi:hypothetical protein